MVERVKVTERENKRESEIGRANMRSWYLYVKQAFP